MATNEIRSRIRGLGMGLVAWGFALLAGIRNRNPDSDPSDSPRPRPSLDLNTASREEFRLLAGIGERAAANLVARREALGRYETVEEVLGTPGVGEGTFERIRAALRVEREP